MQHRESHSRKAGEIYRIQKPRINWLSIISDLKKHGCSGYRIAESLGVARSTVQHWEHAKPNTDITYAYGRALLRLHARYCGAARTFQRITEGGDTAYTSAA